MNDKEIVIEPHETPRLGSGSLERRVITHKLELEDKEFDTIWRSACFTLDKRATIFFTQIGIIVMVMAFAIYQLLSTPSCEGQQAYLGLLTLLLGLVVPSPRLQKQ
jgi:hypothetical protein